MKPPQAPGAPRSSGCRSILPLLAGLWLALFAAGHAGAAELVTGPTVEARPTSATIRWSTDVETGARVRFGTSRDRLDRQAQGPVGESHAVPVEGLSPGTTYHFSIGTARKVLATDAFTTPSSLPSPGTTGGAGTGGQAVPPAAAGAGSGAGGAAASPAALPQAPPTRKTWGSLRTLEDHFQRHGPDFAARDPDDYARQAWEFRQRAVREGLPAKRDGEGVLRIYDPRTRAFGAYNRDGTTRTYFKPGRRNYFDDQPGTPVDLKREER